VARCRDVLLRCSGRGLVIVASLGEHRRPRGIEGTPPRSLLVRAERGNPVRVRPVCWVVGW